MRNCVSVFVIGPVLRTWFKWLGDFQLKEMCLTGVMKSRVVHWMPYGPNGFKGAVSELPTGFLEYLADYSSERFFVFLNATARENPLWRKIGTWVKAR
jgi:hypothetical protein